MQQVTPAVEGLTFGGAVELSSIFDNLLKSSQVNFRPEAGSNTLRFEVLWLGLDEPCLGEGLSFDPFFFF